MAPQPFGVLAEYNVGRGPEYNPATDSIETQSLRGGFVTVTWPLEHDGQRSFPFARYQVYDGGKKHERDARSYDVTDFEFGVEWQPMPAFELVGEWYQGDRRFEDTQRRRTGSAAVVAAAGAVQLLIDGADGGRRPAATTTNRSSACAVHGPTPAGSAAVRRR